MRVRLREIFALDPKFWGWECDYENNLQIFQILIFYYHFHKKTENVMKTHISGGWRPTWWLSIRFKRNTERAQRSSLLLWVPLTWPGVAKNAYMSDIYKCSRASFSREHQTGILSWTINILNSLINNST